MGRLVAVLLLLDLVVLVAATRTTAVSAAITTLTLQNGLNGYSGAKGVGISTYGGIDLVNSGAYNYNGQAFGDGGGHWCVEQQDAAAPSSYNQRTLLKFTGLGAAATSAGVPSPASSYLIKATLKLKAHETAGVGTGFIRVLYAARNWYDATPTSCAGCSNNPVNYRNYDTGKAWAALGAAGTGDTVAGLEGRIPQASNAFVPSSMTTVSGDLDLPTVKGWIDSDTGNYGVLLVNGASGGVHVGHPGTVDNTQADRPILELQFDSVVAPPSSSSPTTSSPTVVGATASPAGSGSGGSAAPTSTSTTTGSNNSTGAGSNSSKPAAVPSAAAGIRLGLDLDAVCVAASLIICACVALT